jgi:hypothetical protein
LVALLPPAPVRVTVDVACFGGAAFALSTHSSGSAHSAIAPKSLFRLVNLLMI